MALSLTLLSYKGQPLAESVTVTVDERGGSIGRSEDNDLVLSDPEKFVSRHHARISFQHGAYYLTDTSLSGVYFDMNTAPLQNDTQQLFNGTHLRVGEYEISVAITATAVSKEADSPFLNEFLETPAQLPVHEPDLFSPLLDDPFANRLLVNSDDASVEHSDLINSGENFKEVEFQSHLPNSASPLFDSFVAPDILSAPAEPVDMPVISSFEDLFGDASAPSWEPSKPADPGHQPLDALFDFKDPFEEESLELAKEAEHLDEQQQPIPVFVAPEPEVPGSLLDIVETPEIQAKPERLETLKPPVQEQTQTSDALFDAFLSGAQLDQSIKSAEPAEVTFNRIGRMFRKMVDGTVAVLRSRAEFKSLFRVNMTVIRAANNNPLKFAVTTDDVLKQLIQNREGGFLGSVEAIEQGFDDIMNHQLAMQAGIQASLNELLKKFDPKTIEKQFEQGIVLQKKAKCWDKYQESYGVAAEEAIENFFGDAFVEAYEAQMSALTAARKK
ncbi:MAG: type VI secretion system-associated FHA domain protein TagH [Methylicorpusculum sp.]|uniref:type VI secretion system-associated FHA domain protein TagH n=1 Tax=Methylicorpusculum sp. TaxID=2713644 RepID=UPI00271F91D5|nr:type VI secretion system-associated FHA domain protein TagH [Methylicorpusculum sp.]MDO8939475.1 type VI secretion system-associated FHA domain protein TagH [Methylicorpusculum sp.]MDP2202996.1 type VI secretion system-associated FHA domain protein TagH [Methylicorpusculum sp.]